MPSAVPQTPDLDEKIGYAPRYNVVLINDDFHTYQYVIELLQTVFGYSVEKSFKMAQEVDKSGRVIVYGPAPFEHAEVKRDQILNFGPDPRIPGCKGGMKAELEEVE